MRYPDVPRALLGAVLAASFALATGCGTAAVAAGGRSAPASSSRAAAAAAPSSAAGRSAGSAAGASASPAPASSAAAPSSTAGRDGIPAFSHVFIIVMENLGYGPAVALPYVAALAARYALATAYDSVAHPSLPNYLALTSGETWVSSDCFFCYQSAPNIGAQLSAAGIPWGAYMQGLPADCSLGPFDLATNYAGKHDPFRYYEDVRGSAALCAHLQPLRVLESLLPPATGSAAGAAPAAQVPRFVWITPNLCNDGHNCAPSTADAWLQSFVPRILRSPAWQQGGVLFLTWDEGNGGDTSTCCGLPAGTGGGHIVTLVMAPGLPAGLRVSVPYDHYSLLATMEDGLGLPLLGHAQTTPPMAAFWAGGK